MDSYGSLDRAVQLQVSTKAFALRIIELFKALPKDEVARVIGRQVLRSGTAIGANYRAVCRARSRKEFIAKLGVVIEESDETVFWLELLVEGGIVLARKLSAMQQESNELLAIFSAARRTAKRKRPKQ